MWAVLIERDQQNPWIVGGDLNASVTFDILWGKKPRGNQELLDRMQNLGFKELLYQAKGELTPTYKHTNNEVIHQMDHLFVEERIFNYIIDCDVGNADLVFGNKLSDHLPIIAEFNFH